MRVRRDLELELESMAQVRAVVPLAETMSVLPALLGTVLRVLVVLVPVWQRVKAQLLERRGPRLFALAHALVTQILVDLIQNALRIEGLGFVHLVTGLMLLCFG